MKLHKMPVRHAIYYIVHSHDRDNGRDIHFKFERYILNLQIFDKINHGYLRALGEYPEYSYKPAWGLKL